MKIKKKVRLVSILCLSLMLVTILVAQGSFFSNAKGESGDDEAFKNAISNSLITMRNVGSYDIKDSTNKAMKTGKTSDLTSDQKDSIKINYSKKLDQYLSNDSSIKKKMKDIQDKVLNYDSGLISSVIENGIFDFSFISKDINEKSAKVNASIISWQKYITEIDSGKFKVIFPVNKQEVTSDLVKEDGEWKTLELNITNSIIDGDKENEKEFDTYEEALQYTNQVMPKNIYTNQ